MFCEYVVFLLKKHLKELSNHKECTCLALYKILQLFKVIHSVLLLRVLLGLQPHQHLVLSALFYMCVGACLHACSYVCMCAGAHGNIYMEAREQPPVLFLLMCCPPCFNEIGFLSDLALIKLGVLTSFMSADITCSHLRGGSFTSVNHLSEKNFLCFTKLY